MSTAKTLIIVLSSFLAAAVVCIAVGLGLYFSATGLPAGDDGRGTQILAGIVVLAVGAINAVVSGSALLVVALKNYLSKRKK